MTLRLVGFLLAGLLLALPTGVRGAVIAGDGLPLALQLAVSLHPSVKSRLAELQALGFDLEAAESQRYPTLAIQASATSDLAGSRAQKNDQYSNVVAVAKQPLWVGGRIDGSIDQAGVKQRIGTLSLLGTQRQLMENTVTAYAGALGARRRVEAASLNLQEHDRLKELIIRRASGGIASQADVQLASSRQSQALAQRLQLEAVLANALNDLAALTQQPLPAMAPIPDGYAPLPVDTGIVAGAVEASATVLLRQTEVELARTTASLTEANLLPSLYAKAEQDLYTANRNGEGSPGTRIGLVLEGSVEGLGLSGWKRLKSSDARIDAAIRDVDAARNDARRQAQALLTELQSQQLVEQSYLLLLASTEETLASFMRQYDAGRKTWIDVLNTQRELSEARLTLEQTRSAVLEKRLRLAVQLGLLDQQAGVVQ